MKRLYLQVYLTVVVSLVLVVVMAGAMWRLAFEASPAGQAIDMAGEIVSALLPPPDAPPEQLQQVLTRISTRLGADLAVFDAQRALVAAAYAKPGAPELQLPEPGSSRHNWQGTRGGGWSMHLPDDRWLAARLGRIPSHPGFSWVAFLVLIALAVALVAHPVVRRLTRRLERLELSVKALGEGDLSARVQVHGHDEVARLAHSFNRAAERIESLVHSHRMLLANASHELRTPLARIRLGLELQKQTPDAKREAELEADIAELDHLIDEILTASRLDATVGLPVSEEVDLLALAAEECARYEACTLHGEPAVLKGDPQLLRRLVRNLLENARKHGTAPYEVHITQEDPRLRLAVCDHGRGIPAEERERIFEPFYRLPGSAGNTGTGLGLSLVRQIARRHGGEAMAGDRAGGGTCISVMLGRG